MDQNPKVPKWKPGDIVSLFWQNQNGDPIPNPPEPLLVISIDEWVTGPHPVYKLMRHDGTIRTRYEFELWDPQELERLRSEQCNPPDTR